MPKAKAVLNAFTSHEVSAVTGLSKPMIDYLARSDFLRPAYGRGPSVRGKVRYYSYRDLVVARVVQRLRTSGVELSRLKAAVQELSKNKTWDTTGRQTPAETLRWLVTDGRTVYIRNDDGYLDEVGPTGQRSFAFVVSLDLIQDEVRSKIEKSKLEHFSMKNEKLRYA